jgi:hypothetical protein
MSNTQTTNEPKTEQDPSVETKTEPTTNDDDFQITVKKLDIVVRPRGVLAE